jgi:hypothetical protein
MEVRFAKIISIIFHPLLMPTYTLLLIFNINVYFSSIMPNNAKLLLLIMILTSTIFVPIIIFSVFLKKKIINSFHMHTKEERNYPFLVICIIYFLMFQLFSQTQIPDVYSSFLVSSTALSLILLLINFRFKISTHTAGIGGVTGLFAGLTCRLNLDLMILTIILIGCSGLVGFSRLKLNSHKPSEVYLGFLAGVSVFLLFALFL